MPASRIFPLLRAVTSMTLTKMLAYFPASQSFKRHDPTGFILASYTTSLLRSTETPRGVVTPNDGDTTWSDTI